uniref:Triacylglycerol lipase n=1 Tax=Leptobrachium leishanense TaxID=445787 RepID=A0A8C5PM53_9ANUR
MDGFVSRRSAPITLLTLLAVHSARAIVGGGPSPCYGELGCFPSDSNYSGNGRILVPAPQTPEKINVTFWLQTRENREQNQILDPYIPSSIKNSNFSTKRLTILVTHGFTDTGLGGWVYEMCKAILISTDCNCVAVSWVNGSGNIFQYLQATSNVRVVGAVIAFFVEQIMKHIDPSYGPCNYTLIGHSLGAHVVGEAGKRLNPRPCAIVGLDPAKPLFQGTNATVQLDPTDGMKVIAFHTDKVVLVSDAAFCGHRRAYEYFYESILNCSGFLAFPCKSYESFVSGSCFPRNKSSNCTYMGFCEVVPCNCMNRTIDSQEYFLTTGSEPSHFQSWKYKVILYTQKSQPSLPILFSATINIDSNEAKFKNLVYGDSHSTFINLGSQIEPIRTVTFMWNATEITARTQVGAVNVTIQVGAVNVTIQVGAVNVTIQSGEGRTFYFCSKGMVDENTKQALTVC